MVQRARRVAVVGAGPAGAIATDALVKEGVFDAIRVFERKGEAGGTWVYTPSLIPGIPSLSALVHRQADLPVPLPPSFPCETDLTDAINSHQIRYADTAVHDTLHSNLPPHTMAFTQEPIPAVVSAKMRRQYGPKAPFRHREVIRQWVADIFERQKDGPNPSISFHTSVERAQKSGDEWILTLRQTVPGTQKNSWWQERFDAVVVASGHYSLPYIPDIPGMLEYDDQFPGRIQHTKHFRSADAYKGKQVILVGGSVSAFDALHEIRLVAKHPVVASMREPLEAFGWGAFTHPHVQCKPPIERFHASGKIEFADGTFVDEADIILFATGYDLSFPYLPSLTPRLQHRRLRGLYQHVFNVEDPSLAMVGMVSGGLTFRVFEWQAVAVARFLAGRADLPLPKDMLEWEENRAKTRGDDLSFYNISPEFEVYFEALRSIAGDPEEGSAGRVLPKFDPAWPGEFSEIVQLRNKWWEDERRRASGSVRWSCCLQ